MGTPRIKTAFIDPPIPFGAHWTAWDDRQGEDTSPIGQGATKTEAMDDLARQLAEALDG